MEFMLLSEFQEYVIKLEVLLMAEPTGSRGEGRHATSQMMRGLIAELCSKSKQKQIHGMNLLFISQNFCGAMLNLWLSYFFLLGLVPSHRLWKMVEWKRVVMSYPYNCCSGNHGFKVCHGAMNSPLALPATPIHLKRWRKVGLVEFLLYV
ncbi:hypothetical protein KFK09_022032 [Dendrobium nobile]|uniref:Uncharacterized protein n=1 Tax=Dendrobium nobile TaxID=94219 RepID=A0A8T3AHJ6_DENNO|nr:hypothetical protein KFK09_022032 [Dendrobium nobile]